MDTTKDRETSELLRAKAERFMENYYRTFDANPADVANLYGEESFLGFGPRGGEKIEGKEAIVAKITSLMRRHRIDSIRWVPFVAANAGSTVMVYGYFLPDGEQDWFMFHQTFTLDPTPQGSFSISSQQWRTVDLRKHPKPIKVDPRLYEAVFFPEKARKDRETRALTMDQETKEALMRVQKSPLIAEAKRFVENYFRTFDANPADLANLYREESVLGFKDEKIKGKEAIVAKLTSLRRCPYRIDEIRCSPSDDDDCNGGAIADARGYIWLDRKQDALMLFQTFDLNPTHKEAFMYHPYVGVSSIGVRLLHHCLGKARDRPL
ncbi:hypothetical protein BT93_H3334 [Corymbia citriodora subsp. variegata]|nr:hypothetical protein BT93_H3334 [Corymbia citriodora subsp. variegata]